MDFQKAFDDVVLFNRWDFDSDFDLSFLYFSDFESDFFKIFEPLIASDREDVLIEIVELLISAFGNDSEHKRVVGAVILEDLVFEFNDDINFLDRAREQSCFSERNVVTINVDKIFGLSEFGGGF